jgi:hypothetical protein
MDGHGAVRQLLQIALAEQEIDLILPLAGHQRAARRQVSVKSHRHRQNLDERAKLVVVVVRFAVHNVGVEPDPGAERARRYTVTVTFAGVRYTVTVTLGHGFA